MTDMDNSILLEGGPADDMIVTAEDVDNTIFVYDYLDRSLHRYRQTHESHIYSYENGNGVDQFPVSRTEMIERVFTALVRSKVAIDSEYKRFELADEAVRLADTMIERLAMSPEEVENRLDELSTSQAFD